MAMDIQRQIADLKAAAPNSLTYTPVPLPNDDRSTRQQRHIELFSNEFDNSPSSNKVADTDFVEFGGINEDEIKKSLMVEVKRRKCWNAKTIEKMTFEEVINTACYHYLLESFTESRCTGDVIDSSKSTSSSALTHENFGHTSTFNTVASSNIEFTSDCGTARISSAAGNAAFSSDFGQNPWDFDVQPDEEFVNQIKVLEMPNSHRMATCSYCNGKSLVHCSHCSGRGTDKCTYCRGTGMRAGVAHPALYTHPMIGNFPGHNHSPCGTSAMGRGYPFSNSAMIRPALLGAQRDKPYAAGTPVHFMAKAGLPPPGIGQHDICIFCHGRGICDCQHCKGQCKKNCMTCSGTGQVPVFTKLKVAFAVECTDYYTSCEVPELMLRQATGELIFSETRPYVQPIRKHQIKEINEISKRFCATHLKKLLDSCRVLKQRHCIERIEVAKVRFRLGSKIGHFFVFGKQRLCFIPKGSASSNCSVM